MNPPEERGDEKHTPQMKTEAGCGSLPWKLSVCILRNLLASGMKFR